MNRNNQKTSLKWDSTWINKGIPRFEIHRHTQSFGGTNKDVHVVNKKGICPEYALWQSNMASWTITHLVPCFLELK
jgi:hypothetical protein